MKKVGGRLRGRLSRAVLAALAVIVFAAPAWARGSAEQSGASVIPANNQVPDMRERSYAGHKPAPPFPAGLDWLNTAAPLALSELRGKVVLLDFWTYGCINCVHDFSWLKKIESDFPDTLVVIGVHSAKFSEERLTRNIREVILRYGLDYPVINDDRFAVWSEWNVGAWPTLALIDPAGNIVGEHVGEGFYPVFKPIVASLVKEFGAKGMIDRRPLATRLESEGLRQSVLSFPGKVKVDASRNRLFIADTGHNRVIVAALDSGEVQAVIGSGAQGFVDGANATAELDHPEGMALSPDGATLYIADTDNHAIRAENLAAGRLTTLLGTGREAATFPPEGGYAPDVALSSPWDLGESNGTLYIAMAGTHQIWRFGLASGEVGPYAGSGYEGTSDGPLTKAALAQPSGLSIGADGRIYFVNSEGSSIRYVDPISNQVVTLAGAADTLFDYGYQDGVGSRALFQHPLGVVDYRGVLYVADTYNNRIRAVNPQTGEVDTLYGGASGLRDGREPLFYEPGGIDAANGKLYIADTDNGVVRVVDLATGVASTFIAKGGALFESSAPAARTTYDLSPLVVAAGAGLIRLDVQFPPGFAPNPQAPSEIIVSVAAGARPPGAPPDSANAVGGAATSAPITLIDSARFEGAAPRFPMLFHASFAPGEAQVTFDLSIVYCRDENAGVCLIKQAMIVLPVVVADGRAALTKPIEAPRDESAAAPTASPMTPAPVPPAAGATEASAAATVTEASAEPAPVDSAGGLAGSAQALASFEAPGGTADGAPSPARDSVSALAASSSSGGTVVSVVLRVE